MSNKIRINLGPIVTGLPFRWLEASFSDMLSFDLEGKMSLNLIRGAGGSRFVHRFVHWSRKSIDARLTLCLCKEAVLVTEHMRLHKSDRVQTRVSDVYWVIRRPPCQVHVRPHRLFTQPGSYRLIDGPLQCLPCHARGDVIK